MPERLAALEPALTPHEERNQAAWDADSDDYQQRHGAQLADSGGLAWGTSESIWRLRKNRDGDRASR
jgi:hypothetical protein